MARYNRPMELTYVLLTAAIVNAVLYVFYDFFKIKWPEFYFSTGDITSFIVSVSPFRYFAFRFLPVLLANILVIAIFKDHLSLNDMLRAGFASGVFYAARSDLVTLWGLLIVSKQTKPFNKSSQVILHIVASAFIVACSLVGGYLARLPMVAYIIPSTTVLIDNIYSSFITAVLVVYLYKLYSSRGKDQEIYLADATRNLPSDIVKLIEAESKKHRANKNLVLAVCATENIQRPKWVRKLENLKGLVFPKGTYGIMQVSSREPLTDEESVVKSVKKYFSHTRTAKGNSELKKIVMRYNNSEQYIDIVMNVYAFMTSDPD